MRSIPWPSSFPAAHAPVDVRDLMQTPGFWDAKKRGDLDAAEEVVGRLISGHEMRQIAQGYLVPMTNVRLVVVSSASSMNQVPLAFAKHFARETGLPLDKDIRKVNTTSHTQKDALQRLLARARFSGRVQRGAHYILVDDVLTTGGTLSDLRQYIHTQGARCVGCVTLAHTSSHWLYHVAGSQRGRVPLAVTHETYRRVLGQFPQAELSDLLQRADIYDGVLGALTEAEARSVLRYGSVTQLEAAMVEARKPTSPAHQPHASSGPLCRERPSTAVLA